MLSSQWIIDAAIQLQNYHIDGWAQDSGNFIVNALGWREFVISQKHFLRCWAFLWKKNKQTTGLIVDSPHKGLVNIDIFCY